MGLSETTGKGEGHSAVYVRSCSFHTVISVSGGGGLHHVGLWRLNGDCIHLNCWYFIILLYFHTLAHYVYSVFYMLE